MIKLKDIIMEGVVGVDPDMLGKVKTWIKKLQDNFPYNTLNRHQETLWVQKEWEKDPEIQKYFSINQDTDEPAHFNPDDNRVYIPADLILSLPVQEIVDIVGHEYVHSGQVANRKANASKSWSDKKSFYKRMGVEKAYDRDKDEMMAHAYEIAQNVYRTVKDKKYKKDHLLNAAQKVNYYNKNSPKRKRIILKYVYAYLQKIIEKENRP